MLQEKQKSYLLDQKFLILCFYLHILEKELKKRNLLSYLKSAPSNLSNLKMCKIWTKNTLLKYFWGKTLKRIVLFKISFLKFASLQNFLRKQKSLTLGPKWLIGYFWQRMRCLCILRQEYFKKLLSYLKSAHSNLCNSKIFWKRNA